MKRIIVLVLIIGLIQIINSYNKIHCIDRVINNYNIDTVYAD